MAVIIRENPIGNFIQDLLDVLETNEFDEIIWVGLHEWLAYITRVFWMKGYNMNTAITPVDSRWGLEAYEDDLGHKIRITSLDYAKKKGNDAIYIIANDYVNELSNQLLEMGISSSRIFKYKNGAAYSHESEDKIERELRSKYKPMTHKEVQDVLLDLLKEFKHFCEKHGLRYYLDWGTLLGAVRHQGFIPWDNDADVAMPFEDYSKLISLYPSGGKYEVMHWASSANRKTFAWLGDNDTIAGTATAAEPLRLDIFPMFAFPEDPIKMDMIREEHRKLCQRWNECDVLSSFGVNNDKKAIWDSFYKFRAEDSTLIGDVYFEPYPIRLRNKDDYNRIDYLMFEGEKFAVPAGWDNVLRERYCDYRNLPPIEERVAYPRKCFWK